MRSKTTRRIALLGAMTIVIAAAVTAYALYHVKRLTQESVATSLEVLLDSMVDSHQMWIEQRLHGLKLLTRNQGIRQHVEALLDSPDDRETLDRLRRMFTQYLKNYALADFFLLTPDLQNLASYNERLIGAVSGDDDWQKAVERASNGESVFLPDFTVTIRSHGSGENYQPMTSLALMAPIVDPSGDVIAVLVLKFLPSGYFNRIARLGRLGSSGETYAFNREGTMISESRFRQQLRAMGLIVGSGDERFQLRISDPGENLLLLPADKQRQRALQAQQNPLTFMAEEALSGRNGINIDGYRDYRGVTVLGAWRWLDEYSFGLTVEIDRDEAMQGYVQARNILISVVATMVLLGVMFVVTLSRFQVLSRRRLQQAHDLLEQRVLDRTRELTDARDALFAANENLQRMATTDVLTGLSNRRFFDDYIRRQVSTARREKQALALMLVDVDSFKQYNDTYGHQQGDVCLRAVAQAMAKSSVCKRPGDIVARYGGEEFVVVLCDPAPAYVDEAIGELQRSVEALNMEHSSTLVKGMSRVTISIGVSLQESAETLSEDSLISQADQALYRAKSLGRNRACIYKLVDAD